ncbi:MAG: dihydroorotate dehydrogenase electron transfer subunit, partial [Eubacterium sp.]
ITCGPRVMMDALCQAVPEKNPVYLSLEARMACGMGACLGCSIKTVEGNKKVCKDGPVFPREVLGR